MTVVNTPPPNTNGGIPASRNAPTGLSHLLGTGNNQIEVFKANSYPFNNDVSNETVIAKGYDCNGGCTLNTPMEMFQCYPLHIDSNTTNELVTVGKNDGHTLVKMPFAKYTTRNQITNGCGDEPAEIVDPANLLGYEGYNTQGKPHAWTEYSNCVDPMSGSALENTLYSPCNGYAGWHEMAIAGGLAAEEITGQWSPAGIAHGFDFALPCGGVCGKGYVPVRLRLRPDFPAPTNAQSLRLYKALVKYGGWGGDFHCNAPGCGIAIPRLFPPQPGDPDYDHKDVDRWVSSIKASDLQVVQCKFENNVKYPTAAWLAANCP